MAKTGANLETLKKSLSERSERINKGTVIRCHKGDEITLIVTGTSTQDVETRGTGFRPKGKDGQEGEEVLSYKFLLNRRGRSFSVFVTLGAFTSLPLVSRGFGVNDTESQRLGVSNAIFAGFEMRSADDIIANLRKGVICDDVYTTSKSQALCYRWRTK